MAKKTKEVKAKKEEATPEAKKKWFGGFFEFLKQYSVIGLAIGLVIGNQSQSLVKTIVDGLLTPFLGLFLPTSDAIKNMTVNIELLSEQQFKVGQVIQSLLEFVIILFIIYFIIKILLRRDDLIEEKKK